MLKRILIFLLVIVLAFAAVANVSAQDLPYYFQVSKEDVHVYWNSDGTMSLDYTWAFTNQTRAHSIDFVDVGMPTAYFDMSTVKADVNGSPVSVSQSDYAGDGSGFAVVMGSMAIPAGGVGKVHVYVGKIEQVLYPDDNDEAYASASFAPTYFGSRYVTGTTDLTLTYHLPKDMAPEEPRWHAAPSGFSDPETVYDANNRITYKWNSPNASASKNYLFGASFPRSYVPAESIYVKPANLGSSDTIFGLLCAAFFGFIFIGIPALNVFSNGTRKLKYLSPRVAIEGHGIKRGLTAVEAAILMEQPLDKVLTMILFGVIKKNAAEVITREPLKIKSIKPVPDGLHEYELNFLKAFEEDGLLARQTVLQEMMVKLVKLVSEKMKGFSRRETLDYYKSIMEKAWQQVEAADTPEVKSQKFDEALEWTMLDKNYDDRTRRVFQGPMYMPMWWGRYNPTYSPASSPKPTVGSGPLPTSVQPVTSSALPGAEFASQMVTGVQTFSKQVVGNINTFTEKVTGATNPLPKPSSNVRSGGGGGGGRSCACACACAGCACACAGGGR